MPVTLDDVRAALAPDEVDYRSAAALGPEALPHLMSLINDDAEPGLAAKAAYLTGLIQDPRAAEAVRAAATSADPRVRVAAAATVPNLPRAAAVRVLGQLLNDDDVGVQKQALRAAQTNPSPRLRGKLQRLADNAPHEALRQLAKDALDVGGGKIRYRSTTSRLGHAVGVETVEVVLRTLGRWQQGKTKQLRTFIRHRRGGRGRMGG